MKRILSLATVAAIAAAGLTTLPAQGATKSIKVVDNKFRPASTSVARGTKVTFKWAGKAPHNVTVVKGPAKFRSKTQTKGTYSKKPVVASLWGGQEDANSFLFKGGVDQVLNPLYKGGTLKKGPQQFVPGWDNQKAGTIFEQMLVRTGNKIDAVAAANDGLANAVVVALKAHKLKPIPLSGQDASAQGVQNIISGWQTMTVFKDVRKLAAAAAKAAIAVVKGTKIPTTGTVKTKGRSIEPAYLIAPQSITKKNYKLLFTSGFLKKKEVCNGTYAKYCK